MLFRAQKMGHSYLKCKKLGNNYLDPENTGLQLYRAGKQCVIAIYG